MCFYFRSHLLLFFLFFGPFSLGHYVACPSSVYGFMVSSSNPFQRLMAQAELRPDYMPLQPYNSISLCIWSLKSKHMHKNVFLFSFSLAIIKKIYYICY
jgi:hypothetical protein